MTASIVDERRPPDEQHPEDNVLTTDMHGDLDTSVEDLYAREDDEETIAGDGAG